MNFSGDNAIYRQIGDYVCENILRGAWSEGGKIPSIRELAVAIEVNPNTVLRSYNLLKERDIIRDQRGLGYFVSPDGIEKTRRLLTDEFVNGELPRVFRTMDLLRFPFEELKSYYQAFRKTHKTKEGVNRENQQ
jgi:GntR family transcriptional regulator